MADDMFVQVSDITGDATETNHEGWIVIQEASWNVERAVEMTDLGSTQRGHANSNFGKIELTSQVGLASNDTMKSVANGTIRPEIIMHWCRSGDAAAEGLQAYAIWTMKHVIIDSYAVSASTGDVPTYTWTLAYTGIEVEFKETDQETAALTTKNTFMWNIRTGKFE